MNRLNTTQRTQILRCLVEGNSIRSTSRITGSSKTTILKYLCRAGAACKEHQDEVFKNLSCTRIECDEMWGFVHCKKKNNIIGIKSWGDAWLWIALCVDSKLVISWLVGDREYDDAKIFISDLYSKLKDKSQLTTDGLSYYIETVEESFGGDVDFTQLVKKYGTFHCKPEDKDEKRYSYRTCIGADKKVVSGRPDKKKASTSHVERQNLTMRMGNRRFTRLTNAFSKKLLNLKYSVSLSFMYYNFVRIHASLGVTPAMEIGITNRLWSLEDVVELIS